MKRVALLFLLMSFYSCNSDSDHALKVERSEPIVRKSDQKQYNLALSSREKKWRYPWQSRSKGGITKEHFRCKGSYANPVRTVLNKGSEPARYFDCGGVDRHSLFLREGKEFVYPILIDLLNYVQNKTGGKVIVTSGYRCPDHNSYVDPSPANSSSKHMIGAAVDFYVQNVDSERVVMLIMQYYKEVYPAKKELVEFERYNKGDSGVETTPWFNKEIYIKLYKKYEGRDGDNNHPFSYICLQVRHDLVKDQKVAYSWDLAFKNYLRK